MKKSITIFLIGILVISGLGAVALPDKEADNGIIKQSYTFSSSEHTILDEGQYVSISFEEATGSLLNSGKPIIPTYVKSFVFPLGTTIVDILVDFQTNMVTLDKKIQPSPQPIPLKPELASTILSQEQIIDSTIYESSELYPEQSYTIDKHAGLVNGENVLIVNVRCYAQYSPATDLISIPENIDIEVSYKLPTQSLLSADEFDLLIVTDQSFVSALQPLVDHKNSNGVRTIVDTTQNIYSTYNGRDNAEDIKLRILDAKEEFGIDYVLLAGGRKGQSLDWIIPSRTTHNDDGWEAGYESDLYFADLYKIVDEEVVFEDWDSSGNGVFAEWSNFVGKKDNMDYYPDVSVGRIPFRSTSQIGPVVQKIIDYETNAQDSWFKKAVVISGDTFPPSRGGSPGWFEGEIETQHTVELLEDLGFEMEKLWLSIPGAWEGPEDVIRAISNGCGFVHFAGHSNPASWGNHPPDDEDHVFIDGIRIWDMSQLSNQGQYPVVMLGGCHSAQFNVTLSHIITGIKEYGIMGYFFVSPLRFFYYEWVPNDLCSWFVIEEGAGAIGAIGNSGLGYGYVNQHADAGLGGWIEPRFFDCYANQSKTIMGEAHTQAISDYITYIGNVNSDQIDRKCIEEWVLLGDPSLRMGGI
jgi:peptidase C25-like protein